MFGKITKQSSKILAKEHENILKVADALTEECDLIKKGKEINVKFFKNVIEGKGIFNLEGKKVEMKEGVLIYMKENDIHSLKAERDTSFLLMLIGE